MAPDRTVSAAPAAITALVAALGLALWQLWPAPVRPADVMVGNWVHPDCLGNHWLLEWVAHQLHTGGSLVHNDRYYWPVGDAPVLAGNGNEGFLYALVRPWLPWPGAVTLYAVAVLTLDGLAGWALARAAGADRWSALVGLAAAGLSPYVVQELSSGRFTQADTAWLLFFLAAWLRFLRRPGAGAAVLAAAMLAITAFFYWYYGFFGVLAGALLLALAPRRPGPGHLALFAAVFLGLIAPWAWLFWRHWQAVPGTAELDVFPHPQSLLEAHLPRLPVLVGEGRAAGQAMAAPAWLAGLAGLVRLARRRGDPADRRTGLALLATWGLFAALALGPLFPHSPYELLYGLAAPLRRFWWPSRHVVVAHAAWATLGALALAGLRRRRPRLALALALLAVPATPAALVLQQAPDRVKLSDVRLPPRGYDRLARLPDGVLVEPPITPEASGTEQQLIYQLTHGKPLLGGHALWVRRLRPPAWDAFVAGNSFLAEMQRLERGELDGPFRFAPADLEALRERGVRWFALNREYLPFGLRELVTSYDALFDALFGNPVIRSKGLAIWDADRWTGIHEVELPPWRWPPEVRPGGPEMPLVGRRPRSPVFTRLPRPGDPRSRPAPRAD